MQHLHNIFLLFVIVTVGGCSSSPYFPHGVFRDEPKLDSLAGKWYSGHLDCLKEPSLFAMRTDDSSEVYRFLWLPTFQQPVAVRAVFNIDGGIVASKRCDGAGGNEPGNLVVNRFKPVSREEKTELRALLESTGFWGLPSIDSKPSGFDGSRWIVEGVRKGKYHLVDRWSPQSGPVRELGLVFVKIGGMDAKETKLGRIDERVITESGV